MPADTPLQQKGYEMCGLLVVRSLYLELGGEGLKEPLFLDKQGVDLEDLILRESRPQEILLYVSVGQADSLRGCTDHLCLIKIRDVERQDPRLLTLAYPLHDILVKGLQVRDSLFSQLVLYFIAVKKARVTSTGYA